MIILTSDQKQLLNSEYIERYCIVEKPDARLIVASYGDARPPVTMGRYANAAEAKDALEQLYSALACGENSFDMPDSILYHGEVIRHDARVKRRGGS